MFEAKPVEIVDWGEDYTVQIDNGLGGFTDFDIRPVSVGDLSHVIGRVDKVRIVDGYGERARYRVRLVRY
jgi:hypothetical protein